MPITWDQLSKVQKQVIQHSEGPMLVLAGPGTGKTEVLTQRVAYLLRNGVHPEDILAITFTKKARNEMIERLAEFEGLEEISFNISTLHGTALKILGEKGELRKYLASSDDASIIFDDAVDDVLGFLSYSDKKDCLKWLELQKANNIRCHECKNGGNKNIYVRYEELLDYNNVQDLSGIILNVITLLRKIDDFYNPGIRHLLVDEYQDINYVEYELIKYLSRNNDSVFFVGDDDQSIYGWRGADPNILHSFKDDFTDGNIITIKESRRCTEYILKGAMEIVNKCKMYFPKKINSVKGKGNKINILVSRNHEKEAIWISNKVLEISTVNNISYNEMAIITKQLNRAEEIFRILNRKGIRTNYWRPNQIFRDVVIRNIVNLFRLIYDRSDNLALRHCLNSIKHYGIGKKGIKNLRKLAEKNNIPIWEILENGNSISECGRWGKNYSRFAEMINGVEAKLSEKPLADCIETVYNIFTPTKTTNIEYLIDFSKTLPEEADLSEFLREFNNKRGLDFGSPDIELEENAINIMSMHASKGLGFKVVFVVGFEESLFPHPEQDLDEQRRLCYVAMTRAIEHLYLCYSYNIVGPVARGFKVYRPSPFLIEIPDDYAVVIQNN